MLKEIYCFFVTGYYKFSVIWQSIDITSVEVNEKCFLHLSHYHYGQVIRDLNGTFPILTKLGFILSDDGFCHNDFHIYQTMNSRRKLKESKHNISTEDFDHQMTFSFVHTSQPNTFHFKFNTRAMSKQKHLHIKPIVNTTTRKKWKCQTLDHYFT